MSNRIRRETDRYDYVPSQTRFSRRVLADTPNPSDYAARLPDDMKRAVLLAAQGSGEDKDSWRVHRDLAPVLRPFGLVEAGGCCLTAFGLGVRRALLRRVGR